MRPRLCILPLLASCLFGSLAVADQPKRFEKQQLSEKYFAEGASVGDFNKDGRLDVICGPYWWSGPDFKRRHALYEGKDFPNDRGYSNNFFSFVDDFSGDGWDDVLVIGLPGTPAHWYENSQGHGLWKKHLAFPTVDNEAPTFADITGDGKPELLCTFEGRLGYVSPNRENPRSRWGWTPISAKGKWQRYSHGLGAGDIDGDGKVDFLMPEGWWRQPATSSDEPWTDRRTRFSGGGAQIYAFDVDGDGDQDVVSSRQAHAWGLDWYEQQDSDEQDGDGTRVFKRHQIMGAKPNEHPHGVAFSQLHALVCKDVDGDGRTDIVTGKCYWAHNGHDPGARDPAVIYWFRNTVDANGKVTFQPRLVDNNSGVGRQIRVVDVDADGDQDIVAANKKGVFVFRQRKPSQGVE